VLQAWDGNPPDGTHLDADDWQEVTGSEPSGRTIAELCWTSSYLDLHGLDSFMLEIA